jgi:CHAD domain-containing protein
MNFQLNQQDCHEVAIYCQFGRQTLLRLIPTLESQADGIRKGEDVECVHKMRVASRRLRAAMPLFRRCFPNKRFRKWLKQIKQITRFLGEARDLDVQTIFTQEYLKNHSATSSSNGHVKLLLEDLTSRRANVKQLFSSNSKN